MVSVPSGMGPDAPGASDAASVVGAPGELRVDPDVVEEVGRRLMTKADALDADLSGTAAGVPYLADARRSTTSGFESSTEVPEGEHWFGEWPTAGEMEHGLRTARHYLTRYYRDLVAELREAGALLVDTADNYRDADDLSAVQVEVAGSGGDLSGAGPSVDAAGRSGGGGAPLVDSGPVPKVQMCEDVSDYDPQWIVQQVERLRQRQPWVDLSCVAGGFRSTAERLADVAEFVRSQSEQLAQVWSAPAQVACQGALVRIADTASGLAERAQGVGTFAEASADELARRVAEFPELAGRSFGEWVEDAVTWGGAPNKEAQHAEVHEALARWNGAYMSVNATHLPATIDIDCPNLSRSDVSHEDAPPRPNLPPAGVMRPADGVSSVEVEQVPSGSAGSGVGGGPVSADTTDEGLLDSGGLASVGGSSVAGGAPAAGGVATPATGGGTPAGSAPAAGGVPAGGVVSAGSGSRPGVVSSTGSPSSSVGRGVAPGVAGGTGNAGSAGSAAGGGRSAAASASGRAGTLTGQPGGAGMVGSAPAGGAGAGDARGSRIGGTGASSGAGGSAGRMGAGHAMPGGRAGATGGREDEPARSDAWLREDQEWWEADDVPPRVVR